jgi:hypothetical protein
MGDVDQVVEDLFLPWILACPVGIGLEGKRVEMAPNVLRERKSERVEDVWKADIHSSIRDSVDHSKSHRLGCLSPQ